MPDVAIQSCDLSKCFGKIVALNDCDIHIQRGEIFGLLGPNGAGKTTLIRLLLGYLTPTRGWAQITGLDCHRDSVAIHERVAYLPGEVRLFRGRTGRQILKFFADAHPAGRFDRAVELARQFALDLDRQVAFYSTGMRQKLALAALLTPDCPVLVLDEPTTSLDPSVRSEVLSVLRESRARGQTILFSSHVLSETEQICDRVGILRSGRLVHTQEVSELRLQHRIRARLTGTIPQVPDALADEITLATGGDLLSIETAGELAPLLGWLSQLPIAEVRIEPVSLQAVYERFHGEPTT